MLIDLERRKAIDMIPSREAEDVARWLKQYPDVEVVSRDQSPIYATAVSLALPNANQIADRFHIVKNIYEVLEKILHPERRTIAQVSEEVRRNTNRINRENQSPIENERFKMPKNTKDATEINRSAARARRIEKYETVKRLTSESISISEISRQLRMDRHLVRHFSRCDEYPEVKPNFRKISSLGSVDITI